MAPNLAQKRNRAVLTIKKLATIERIKKGETFNKEARDCGGGCYNCA